MLLAGTRHSSAQRPEELDPLHLLTTLMCAAKSLRTVCELDGSV